MKVWISKYALTKGVVVEVEAKETCFEYMVCVDNALYFRKPDWHETRSQAMAHAESMRLRKIDSLLRKVDELKGMKFE